MSMMGARVQNNGNRILPPWGCAFNRKQKLTGNMSRQTPKAKNGKGNWKEAKYVCVPGDHPWPSKSLHRLPGKPLRREAVPRKISTKQMQKKTLCEKKLLVQSHT